MIHTGLRNKRMTGSIYLWGEKKTNKKTPNIVPVGINHGWICFHKLHFTFALVTLGIVAYIDA